MTGMQENEWRNLGVYFIRYCKTDEEMKEHLASLPNGGQNQLGNNGVPVILCMLI